MLQEESGTKEQLKGKTRSKPNTPKEISWILESLRNGLGYRNN